MATRLTPADFRIVPCPTGAGFVLVARGRYFGNYWFETAGEGRDFVNEEFA